MTIKQKLAIYLTRQKPILVYTNGKGYIGLEEFDNGIEKYCKWIITDISNAYNFDSFMYKLFSGRLIKTINNTFDINDGTWYFTKIQFIKKGDIV